MASTSSSSSSSLASLSGTKTSINYTVRRPDAVRFRPSKISAAYASVERPRFVSISTTVGSLYDVLGIQTSASFQEIKQAYRRQARVSHPDVACFGDDEFIRIHSAYATLSDPEKRADYDRTIMFVTRRSRSSEMDAATSYGYSTVYGNRRWETDQCW